MSEIKIKLAAGTDVGLVRKNNEDNFVVNRDLSQSEWIIPQSSETIPLGKYGTLLVVADGMGGTNAGEVASAIAIETVQNAFTPEKLDKIVTLEDEMATEEAIEEFLTKTVKAADLNIVNASKEDSSTQRHVLLLSIAWILNEKAIFVGAVTAAAMCSMPIRDSAVYPRTTPTYKTWSIKENWIRRMLLTTLTTMS